ncbi:hypothetical protein CXB51_035581 [Gossypium anomalum]|uniref:Uncharacterized protein n=1 Tax=Gossypium anomalum TaxID=47600 RepID=A0A8J5XRH3_9ROSI|nr:hypothetical protein CXB51_035581 [Gossypium anomalum]
MDTKNTCKISHEDLEETLSFCDLSLENYQDIDDISHHSLNSPSHDHQHFEFPIVPNTPLNNNKANEFVFCGKLINDQGFVDGDGDQSRSVFRLTSVRQFNKKENGLGSFYLLNSKPNSCLSTKGFRSQSYSCLRKHKALIGITKIEPKMELGDMKKRQSRRNHPLPMFPPMATGDMAMVEANDVSGSGEKRGRRWSLLRCLRGTPNLFSAFAKTSLRCIPGV